MNMMILVLALCFANMLLTAYGITLIERATKHYDYNSETVTENVNSRDETVTEMMTVDEHVRLREQAHDQRIMEMKEELARKNFPTKRPQNVDAALELDPNVKNLPHNIIDGYNGRSLTEVSE